MNGYLIFNGGAAFTPNTRAQDRAWLNLVRRQSRARLAIVPVAAVQRAQKVAFEAQRYFRGLGTLAEIALIDGRNSANTEAEYEILNKVDGIVFTDGSPLDMVERLRGTRTAEATERAAVERHAAVMTVGASAAALGAYFWLGGVWEPGLNIATGLAILPRHDHMRMRFTPEKLLVDLPQGVTLIGVDDDATLLRYPDGTFQVMGDAGVSVYHATDRVVAHAPGTSFTLDAAPDAMLDTGPEDSLE